MRCLRISSALLNGTKFDNIRLINDKSINSIQVDPEDYRSTHKLTADKKSALRFPGRSDFLSDSGSLKAKDGGIESRPTHHR